MRSLPTSCFGRASENHLPIALPTKDVTANGIVRGIEHQVSALLEAQELKGNLVKGPHEALVHPDGLLDRHRGDPTVYFEVLHSHSEVLSTGRSYSYTFRRD